MNKRKKGFKLSRSKGARYALYRSLMRAFLFSGYIETSHTKAKMMQPRIEKIIQKAKKGDLSKIREVYADMANNREVTEYLFDVVAPAFKEKKNGFTTLEDMGVRRGDNSKRARLEWSVEVPAFVSKEDKKKQEKKAKKQKKTKKTKK